MKNKFVKRALTMGLAAGMMLCAVSGCAKQGEPADDAGSKEKREAKDASFTWWIYKTDGEGTYYEDYKDNPGVQYINAQYWDVENGGIGTEETGVKLDFSFLTPISGSESDNFNTMISTGDYPEILDLTSATDTPQVLHENGVLMDITEYVEKYMPNYLAYLDANPELKPFVQAKDESGSPHYYALYNLKDGVEQPWQGVCYRRDWVVKYAQPTEYVWDWESDYVKKNGHPAVTPLEKAVEEKNMDGWKKNEVKEFKADYGENPDEDYTDNVIFPSGTNDPLTISDWEWMYEAFDKAIKERGWEDDSNSYCMSVSYMGYISTGNIVSSFGGGTGAYYIRDGKVSFDGASDNFKAYLECVKRWYEEGWLDKDFNTRAGDLFYKINISNVSQGKIGMWDGHISNLGTALRATCQNEEDAKDSYVMPCSYPINDAYGTEQQMYHKPDAMFQMGRVGGKIGITPKAEGKDLEALFTYLDWTYTREGALVLGVGLTKEQLESVELNPDLYGEYSIDEAYELIEGEDGKTVIKYNVDQSDPLVNAIRPMRLITGIGITNTDEYALDYGVAAINQKAYEIWSAYLNTGGVLDYTGLLNAEEGEAYSKVNTALTDYQAQTLPGVIKGETTWEAYVDGLKSIDPDSVTEYLQKYVVE